MCKYVIFCCLLFVPFYGHAQLQDKDVENIMNKHALTANDALYNVVSYLPDLYRQDKMDVVHGLIAYYEKKYGNSATLIYFDIIERIKNRSFKEEINNAYSTDKGKMYKLTATEYYEQNIIVILKNYRTSSLRTSGAYGKEPTSYYTLYFNFLRGLAREQMNITDLSMVEKWLLVYFSNPADTLFTVLDKPEYKNTALQRAWMAYERDRNSLKGGNLIARVGMYAPIGNAALLGGHPYIGVGIGGAIKKMTIDADFTMRFVSAPRDYQVVASNHQVYNTRYYFGGYVGFDGTYALLQRKKEVLDLLCGVGWDGFDALPGDNRGNSTSAAPTKTISSVNCNFGIGYRVFGRGHSYSTDISKPYIGVQVKYNVLNYKNAGGTDLSGSAFTVGFVYGSYHRKPKLR